MIRKKAIRHSPKFYHPGEVILILYPYSDFSDGGKRPAVIVSNTDFNNSGSEVVVVSITSTIRTGPPTHIMIDDSHGAFRQTGLDHSSTVLCHKIYIVAKDIIICRAPSPRATVYDDGTITIEDPAQLWNGKWQQGLIWGYRKPLLRRILIENEQVTASGVR